jgi:hypothetical protein
MDACDLPEVIRSKVALLLWQREFCEDAQRFEECARYQIALEGQEIPGGMLPNGYRLGQPLAAP